MLLSREELQERLIALHQASLQLVEDVSLETLLQRIAKVACEQSSARYAAVGVLDETGKLMQFIPVGMSEQEIEQIWHPPIGLGLIGALMGAEHPIRLPDLTRDPRSVGFPPNHPPMRSFLGVPIRSADRQLGQIYLTEKIGQDEFTADDEKIIQMLAAYAAAAIQNARLHTNARRLAVLEERERIGMDLHDGIIQSIYGVGLSMENILHYIDEEPAKAKEGVKQAVDKLNHVIRDLRSYILDLRPRQMDGDEGLIAGLKRLATEYRANTLGSASVSGAKADLDGLPKAHGLALFHICQEALANVAKHSGAKRVTVTVWTTDERVLMEIRDNGKGFDVDKMNKSIGHGLANMQTRARSVGGDVDISSQSGDGTAILVWVPRV